MITGQQVIVDTDKETPGFSGTGHETKICLSIDSYGGLSNARGLL
jgi:hypothetical protein